MSLQVSGSSRLVILCSVTVDVKMRLVPSGGRRRGSSSKTPGVRHYLFMLNQSVMVIAMSSIIDSFASRSSRLLAFPPHTDE